MKLPRTAQVRILSLLNNSLPPVVRDSRLVMAPLMRIAFGKHAQLVMDFKDRAMAMTEEEFVEFYRQIAPLTLSDETDLNPSCASRIVADVVGPRVLEAGCGRGFLARTLANEFKVTACDLVIEDRLRNEVPAVTFSEANIEALPFDTDEFDTVVCTHTLEHTRDLLCAISELRRVAGRRLIVVVPKERPYRYTFNAHLHFFPYEHSLLAVMGVGRKATCEIIGGDLLYIEDF